jgi:hypothetical protein
MKSEADLRSSGDYEKEPGIPEELDLDFSAGCLIE